MEAASLQSLMLRSPSAVHILLCFGESSDVWGCCTTWLYAPELALGHDNLALHPPCAMYHAERGDEADAMSLCVWLQWIHMYTCSQDSAVLSSPSYRRIGPIAKEGRRSFQSCYLLACLHASCVRLVMSMSADDRSMFDDQQFDT